MTNIESTGLKDISEFIIDQQSGMITGYKTKVGADTVFPFSSGGWCAIGNCTIPETGNYHVYALGCAWCVDSWGGNRYAMTVSRNGTAIYSGSCFSTSSDSVPGTLTHSQQYALNKGDSITYSISTGGQGKNIGSVLVVAKVK